MKDTFYGRNRSASPDPDIPDAEDFGDDAFGDSLPDDLAALQSNIVASQPNLSSIREPLFAPDEDEDELAALAEAEAMESSRQDSRPDSRQDSRPRVVDMGDAPIDIGEEDEW